MARMLFITFFVFAVTASLVADDWIQWRGENRDGRWNEDGIVGRFEPDSLKVLWRHPINPGYSGPTVAEGRVFVMDHVKDPSLERVVCLDEKTGESNWTCEYPVQYKNVGYIAGPRASVTIDGKQAYALGTMGHLNCLSVDKGDVVWSKDLDQEYKITQSQRMPIWGIAGSPIVFNDLVIIHLGAPDGACVVAFDKKTGVEKWRALDDRGQYSSPILYKQNDKNILIVWTGDSVAGLNPQSGDVYWRHEFKPTRMPIGIATPIVHDDKIFVTSFYDGSLLLKMKPDEMSVEEVWKARGANERTTDALHSIISTPIWLGDCIYGVDSYGELRCINAADGKRIWENNEAVPKARWSTIHFVQNGDNIWMFNERGELLLGQLSPEGFKEISRARLIEPTTDQLRERNGVCWSHPAFANRCVFLRNDKELICVSLKAD